MQLFADVTMCVCVFVLFPYESVRETRSAVMKMNFNTFECLHVLLVSVCCHQSGLSAYMYSNISVCSCVKKCV